jgi:hypothetical protein
MKGGVCKVDPKRCFRILRATEALVDERPWLVLLVQPESATRVAATPGRCDDHQGASAAPPGEG